MSLLDDIELESQPAESRCWYRERLIQSQRDAVDVAMERGYSVAAIRRGLDKSGLRIGETSVWRHVKGQCRCH